jgi:hypothetical protein
MKSTYTAANTFINILIFGFPFFIIIFNIFFLFAITNNGHGFTAEIIYNGFRVFWLGVIYMPFISIPYVGLVVWKIVKGPIFIYKEKPLKSSVHISTYQSRKKIKSKTPYHHYK